MAIKRWWKTAVAAMSSMLLSAVVYAQDAPIDVTVNTQSSPWYGQWYVWAIGVGVFLIIVIALTNRGSRQT